MSLALTILFLVISIGLSGGESAAAKPQMPAAGATTRASVSSSGVGANDELNDPIISDNFRYVVFESLASSDTVRPTIIRTASLAPVKDNTLYESEIGVVSNGEGQYLFAGVTQNGDIRRAALAFDLSGIPSWATVLSATLVINMSKTIAGPADVSLHALTADWGEGASDALGEEGAGALAQPGDTTWIYTFFDTEEWATAGGDFEATPLAVTTVGDFGPYTWASAELLADVAGWAADPATNFGWVLLGDESGPGTAKRFDSRENDTNGLRLTITYSFEGEQEFMPTVLYQPFLCFPNAHEQENNDSPSTANGPLCAPGVFFGYPNDEEDYFYFNTSEQGPIEVEVKNHLGQGVQLQLYYNTVIGDPVAEDLGQIDGLKVSLQDSAPGRYYVLIYTETPNPGATQPYEMTVAFP